MGLGVGIVGLPNVGKSTTFNALTKAQNAQAENYPFCTIEPNKAIVPVPDVRLDELAKIVNPDKIQHSTIDFVDIAGLVRGASKGEGLGNQFLSNIREVEVILHMVRCFEDGNITHVEGDVNPLRDIEIIETELIYADISQLEKKIERLKKQAKGSKEAASQLVIAEELYSHIGELQPVKTFEKLEDEAFVNLDKELRFLSNKDVIYGANVDEDTLSTGTNKYVDMLKEHALNVDADVIVLCAKIEEELVGLSDEEANEFLTELGVKESGLEQIIQKAFDKLGLQSYFTAGKVEVRAWTIKKNTKAPQAAAVIHNDFEKGFIKAEVISYEDFIKYGGETKCKDAGKLRLEGKDYIVQNGDVMHFRFNV
ncbi:Ribosome-binding ATPase YchF [Aliarcobacter thereius]|uniref:Ribosome-binding ATPase YchF n=2 Tax=Aliarcobacter thereius TaxID=544718 RepID=A0A1C0B624_9BACT|nr:redox-regulated ATPase YchF [Aliarcobacter thereius]OCL86304.1 Ribosome-binding ATPase YchF [Aliarcobacter thereius]OCL89988.1 Ribosome-binding ATPase YchF [Aliarcobacter thereius]OCL96412.1 iron-regulated outer membrane protein IrgA [Aliarcobacter thereius LMG 24486]OCL98627.1 Ribosome-binding ATPase YchF [Aliarcobacter thereius]QBF15627.1 GTP-binding protein, putative GTP-dependent translation factor [Aliarcobacter thereius LMG 24486]